MPSASVSMTIASSVLAICAAQTGMIRALARKLGVYGHEGMVRHARTRVGEVGGGRDRLDARR